LFASTLMLEFRSAGGISAFTKERHYNTLYIDHNMVNISNLPNVFPDVVDYLGLEIPYQSIIKPIPRALWSGKPVDHEGTYYRFRDVDIHPVPSGNSMPMWYGGTTLAAVRRAAESFDGWSAGNMPGRDYVRLRTRLESLCHTANRPMLESSITPFVSPGRTFEDGVRHVPIARMSSEFLTELRYQAPDSGRYESIHDFDGAVLVGPADVITEGVLRHHANGVNLVIFDLRLRFDDWAECLQLLGEDVLPLLRRRG